MEWRIDWGGGLGVVAAVVIGGVLGIMPQFVWKHLPLSPGSPELVERIGERAFVGTASVGDVCWVDVVVIRDGTGWVPRESICSPKQSPLSPTKIQKVEPKDGRQRFVLLELHDLNGAAGQDWSDLSYSERLSGQYIQVFRVKD